MARLWQARLRPRTHHTHEAPGEANSGGGRQPHIPLPHAATTQGTAQLLPLGYQTLRAPQQRISNDGEAKTHLIMETIHFYQENRGRWSFKPADERPFGSLLPRAAPSHPDRGPAALSKRLGGKSIPPRHPAPRRSARYLKKPAARCQHLPSLWRSRAHARGFLTCHCLRDPLAHSTGGSAPLPEAGEAAEKGGIARSRQQNAPGTALSWKSIATGRRMREMSSHLSIVFCFFCVCVFLCVFFFFLKQLKAATQPVPPCSC